MLLGGGRSLCLFRNVEAQIGSISQNDKWRGSFTLLVQFPRLYAILNYKMLPYSHGIDRFVCG
jgi:hypothetical protein